MTICAKASWWAFVGKAQSKPNCHIQTDHSYELYLEMNLRPTPSTPSNYLICRGISGLHASVMGLTANQHSTGEGEIDDSLLL